jgi:RNA polymerase sigma-70 factor (ECF subfamily)
MNTTTSAPTACPSAPDESEDDRLLKRAQRGDLDAFREIHDRASPRLRNYLAGRVSNAEIVDDLLQQTFLAAWLALPRYEARGIPLEAWLVRIARNKVVDHYRRRRAAVSLELVDVSGIVEPSDIEEQALRRERHEMLRHALAGLPPAQRRVLLLRFFGERSAVEVGELTRTKPVTVRGIQLRALRSLRHSLDEASFR